MKFLNLIPQIKASIYYPTCSSTVPDPSCSDCPGKELGDIRSVHFTKDTYTWTDITDPTEWATAIANKDVIIIPRTKGSLEQTPTESVGFGDQEMTLDGYDYVLRFTEPEYQNNWNFWNSIKSSQIYRVGFRTETQIHESENVARITPRQTVTEDKKAAVNWAVEAKFSQEDLIRPYDAPLTIFQQCINVS